MGCNLGTEISTHRPADNQNLAQHHMAAHTPQNGVSRVERLMDVIDS